ADKPTAASSSFWPEPSGIEWARPAPLLPLQRLRKPQGLALVRRHQLALPHDIVTAHDRADRPTGDSAAVIGRPAGSALYPVIGDGFASLEVHDREIRIISDSDAALIGNSDEAV